METLGEESLGASFHGGLMKAQGPTYLWFLFLLGGGHTCSREVLHWSYFFEGSFIGEEAHKSTLWCKGFSIRSSWSKGASFQWIEQYLRRVHHAWAHLSLLDLCCNLRQAAIVSCSFVSCTCCIPPSILHIYILPFHTSFPPGGGGGGFIQGHVDQKYFCSFHACLEL
jgi:hypothetical protein